jgi:hypothetical protein
MPKPLAEAEPWEDPIVAEVRQARERLFAAAGYDLEEFCRRLNEQHTPAGSRARPSGTPKGRTRRSRRRPRTGRA